MLSSETLWSKFANYENFLLAWQRTVNGTSRMVHDELGMKTFAYNLQTNLEDLVRQIKAEDFPYTPLADHKVYVPKPSTTLRTMSLMAVSDVIVYQALVNVIADQSHPYLVTHENQHILGNLYAGSGKRWMLQPWKRQYTRFVSRVETLYHAGNPWIASTDVVAFYDTIDHERLLSIIRQYCGEEQRFEDFFRACLSKWSAHNASYTMSRGIPQGSNASDFLANLFLHEIDRKIIANGYHYVRYVDDIRILGSNKSTVQRGLILFDLELKCAGLVAQVTKTSVHKIDDINKEVSHLKFLITDPAENGDYILVTTPFLPVSEQAESVANYVENTPSDQTEIQNSKQDEYGYKRDDEEDFSVSQYTDLDKYKSETLQKQLRSKFLEAFKLLGDLDRGKEAESHITFCLYRIEPHETIRNQVISLLSRLPWRSEAISLCLGRFKNDSVVIEKLTEFISEHNVYSWHRANSLWALHQAGRAKDVVSICRAWLADTQLDWYARAIAARILAKAPGQHAFFFECLKREQDEVDDDIEATVILRQELAYSAFQRIKAFDKQLALLKLVCSDQSPLLHRLAIYFLQQAECKVTWDDLKPHHQKMSNFSDLIKDLGLSADAPKPCFISQTLSNMYHVSLSCNNLRSFYSANYDRAVEHLRDSVSHYHKSPGKYVSTFHQFAHITLIAFYKHVLPSEEGLKNYGSLTHRTAFTNILPRSFDTWKRLGSMRNRVDHPFDENTKSLSKKITFQEVEFLYKELQVALQEAFDVWLSTPITTSTETVEVITAEAIVISAP